MLRVWQTGPSSVLRVLMLDHCSLAQRLWSSVYSMILSYGSVSDSLHGCLFDQEIYVPDPLHVDPFAPHVQPTTVCVSLTVALISCQTSNRTDSHTSTSSVNFYRPDALPDAQPTASSTEGWLTVWNVSLFAEPLFSVWRQKPFLPIECCCLFIVHTLGQFIHQSLKL